MYSIPFWKNNEQKQEFHRLHQAILVGLHAITIPILNSMSFPCAMTYEYNRLIWPLSNIQINWCKCTTPNYFHIVCQRDITLTRHDRRAVCIVSSPHAKCRFCMYAWRDIKPHMGTHNLIHTKSGMELSGADRARSGGGEKGRGRASEEERRKEWVREKVCGVSQGESSCSSCRRGKGKRYAC